MSAGSNVSLLVQLRPPSSILPPPLPPTSRVLPLPHGSTNPWHHSHPPTLSLFRLEDFSRSGKVGARPKACDEHCPDSGGWVVRRNCRSEEHLVAPPPPCWLPPLLLAAATAPPAGRSQAESSHCNTTPSLSGTKTTCCHTLTHCPPIPPSNLRSVLVLTQRILLYTYHTVYGQRPISDIGAFIMAIDKPDCSVIELLVFLKLSKL